MNSQQILNFILSDMNPSIEQIQQLHLKYAPTQAAYERVFMHCQIVAAIAEQLIATNEIVCDTELVHKGALLHDIGSYHFITKQGIDHKNYYKHALFGYEVLKKEHIAENLCLIVQRHFGVGIDAEDIRRQQLDLPLENFIPQTTEEKLVCYADKFHSKHPRFNAFETYRGFAKTFGEENEKRFLAFAKEFGKPDLLLLQKKYHHAIV